MTTQQLIDLAATEAMAIRSSAYAPYSNFHMGAAIVTAEGDVVPGVLIENVSLGLAMCAERVALFGAVTRGARPPVLALCSRRTADELTFPSGAFLQVALEIAGPDLIGSATADDAHAAVDHLMAELDRGLRKRSAERLSKRTQLHATDLDADLPKVS